MNSYQQLLEKELPALDLVIKENLTSSVSLVHEVAEYLINNGGKRLRPVLVILLARALSYSGKTHLKLATVVEFIHTATLLHDDVVDESQLRRGNLTANARFGNSASVLVGDFIYSRAFQLMVKIGNSQILAVMADATNIIAEGEVMQLVNCHDTEVEEARYLQVIRYKTARLFSAAAECTALLCQADQATSQGMAEFGSHLGTAFQLIDDLLDYSGDSSNIGKNVGDDLAEGKPTMPLIYALRHGNRAQVNFLRLAITEGGREKFADVLQIINETNGLKHTQDSAIAEIALAKSKLSLLADTPYKAALSQFADLAINRRS